MSGFIALIGIDGGGKLRVAVIYAEEQIRPTGLNVQTKAARAYWPRGI